MQHQPDEANIDTFSPQYLSRPIHYLDLNREIERVKTGVGWQNDNHSARTLVKSEETRLVLITMKPYDNIQENRSEGSFILHILTGTVDLLAATQKQTLQEDNLLFIDKDVPYEIRNGPQESSLLLTIFLQK